MSMALQGTKRHTEACERSEQRTWHHRISDRQKLWV